jgi:hypothetical protein
VLSLIAVAVTAGNPWAHARVGDAVEYQVTSKADPYAKTPQDEARLALEVVALDGGIVSVRASVRDRAFLIDVLAEQPPIERAPIGLLGEPSRVDVAGGTVTCRAWVRDERSHGGARLTVCESFEGPLYLTDGAVRRHEQQHGGRGFFDRDLVLTSIKRGSASAAGLPRLPQTGWARGKGDDYREVFEERFVGGRWIEAHTALRRIQRTRADLQRTDLIHLRSGWFTQDTPYVRDLGSLLDLLITVAATAPVQPDAWSAKLEGLPVRQRLDGHADVEEWGPGAPPGPTRMDETELPDMLTRDELIHEMIAISQTTQCLASRNAQEKTHGGNMPYDYQLKLKLSNGKATSATLKLARLPTDYPAPMAATTRCLEGELLKHAFPKTNPVVLEQEVSL